MMVNEHVAVKLFGKWFCAKCGVKYPCLVASEAAMKRAQERNSADHRHV